MYSSRQLAPKLSAEGKTTLLTMNAEVDKFTCETPNKGKQDKGRQTHLVNIRINCSAISRSVFFEETKLSPKLITVQFIQIKDN